MANIPRPEQYWDKVKVLRAALPETVTITSLDNYIHNSSAGSITDVDNETASRLIAKQTHRLATPEEIAKDRAETEARRKAIVEPVLEQKRHYLVLPEGAQVHMMPAPPEPAQSAPPQVPAPAPAAKGHRAKESASENG